MPERIVPSHSERQPRTCEACGSDTYMAAQTDRLRDARYRAEARAEKIARENGLLMAQVKWAREDNDDQIRGMQRKLRAQANVIRRLERRLRERGEQPHAGVDFTETVSQNGVDPL